MATTYGRKKNKQNNILYAGLAAILICAVFLTLLKFFYTKTEKDAYETLHIQTKQIKDDLSLQIKSDRENLITMANFAAKLYADGENYDIMFDSFAPIGLFSNIGILNPDNTFVTKAGCLDLSGKISFEDEALKGKYISGRTEDLTREGKELVRSAVPIVVGKETVGILYGVIHLDTLANKYNAMAKELDAQLFVYDKETGKFVIDTINKNPGELSQLKTRQYNDGYSYEELVNSDKGYSSFKSIHTGEDLYIHYSTLEEHNWGILLARYETQVFAEAHKITTIIALTFIMIISIVIVYFIVVLRNEKHLSYITKKASEIRKQLIEINQKPENIESTLESIIKISASRSAIFVDTKGEEHKCSNKKYNHFIPENDRKYFVSELFRYVMEFEKAKSATMCIMSIKPDKHLLRTNPKFYEFLKKNSIFKITFAGISYNNTQNDIGILGVVNPKNKSSARALIEEIAVCFSIAIYNKNHLNKTYVDATTDSLTGVLNRVAYKKDLLTYDEESPEKFTCIYIDVNELHLRNNRYGHAEGDKMLIYIATALKNIFYDQKIYRMGGDEFLVLVQNTELETVKRCIEIFIEQLDTVGYAVAIGISHREHNTDTENMVKEAEIKMYEAKAQYYQKKVQNSYTSDNDESYIQTSTGIKEIDTMLSVLNEHYNGIYSVNLDNDSAHRILMPSYLGYKEDEDQFSKLFMKYVNDSVHPDFHRAVISFLNYDALKRQIAEGNIPRVRYKKNNSETVVLSVYKLDENKGIVSNTLWVFAKA